MTCANLRTVRSVTWWAQSPAHRVQFIRWDSGRNSKICACFSRLYTSRVKRWWTVVVVVLILVLVGGGAAVYIDWTWKRKLSPRGGRPFLTRVELPVPSFQQGDDKWRDDPL